MIFRNFLLGSLLVLCGTVASAQQYATVTSTEGWSITVTLQYKQMRITNPGDNCKWGYNYVLDMDYTVSYNDEGAPRMWWLAAGGGCFTDNTGAVGIPEGSGTSGTITSPQKWADRQPGVNRCDRVDYTQYECNTVYLTFSGPGIPQQTVRMQDYQSMPSDGSAAPPTGGGSTGAGSVGPAPGGEQFQLPITLVDFWSVTTTDGIELDWETESEESNAYFTVERSHDAVSWQALKTIAGSGSTRERTTYSFTDTAPLSGTNYYRLVQVDFSGKATTFPVISTEADASDYAVEVYPNPVSDQLYVRSARGFKIFDLRGQELTSALAVADRGNGGYVVNVSGLSRGVYVLRAGTEVRRFVRQ